MKAFCCQPQVVTVTKDGYTTSIGVPTFYLFRSVLGIVNQEQADAHVVRICNPTKDPAITVHPNATLVDVITEFES